MCSSNIYYNTNVYTETYVCNYVCVWGGGGNGWSIFLKQITPDITILCCI